MRLLADFILVFGFAITSVILFMLAKAKNRELPQNILIVLLGFILVTIISFYAGLHRLKFLYLVTLVFENGERFIMGPLIFIYVKSLFLENKGLVKKHLVHLVPFVLYWLVFTLPFVASSYLGYVVFDYLKPFHNMPYLALIKDAYLLLYLILSIRLFYRFKAMMKFNYSSFITNNVQWLKLFLLTFFGLLLFDFIITLYEVVFGYFTSWDTGYITAVFMIILVTYLGYNGIKQSVVTMPDFLLDEEVGKANNKNGNSPIAIEISEEELLKLQTKLEAIVLTEKPYLLHDLTLTHLAKMIETTDKKLSLLLNRKMKMPFYDYINKHRVETVKEKLASSNFDNFSLIGIAYDSGFKSKSSFYRIFKKETGVSPSQYKQALRQENSPSASAET